jgi:hypothetical protein
MAALTQKEAAELFGVPTQTMYVCDGKKECGKPCCLDRSRTDCCHHTADTSHARYAEHTDFSAYPATRGEQAVIVLVERLRG